MARALAGKVRKLVRFWARWHPINTLARWQVKMRSWHAFGTWARTPLIFRFIFYVLLYLFAIL